MTPDLDALASRRALVGALVLGVTAAGCDLDPPADPEADPSPSRGSDRPEPADPDEQLVRRVSDDLAATLALVAGVARAGRPAARQVTTWRRLHAAHLQALEADRRVRPTRVRGPVPALLARVRREEAALQRRLAEAAVSAQSGALASLLATMSAGVAQRLAADAGGGR